MVSKSTQLATHPVWKSLRVLAALTCLALIGIGCAQAAEPKLSIQWEAESLSHNVGRPEKGAWSASPQRDSEGFLTYGPYYNGAAASDAKGHSALWQLAIDDIRKDDAPQARLEVVDADDNGAIIATRDVTRREWKAANAFQWFAVPFTWDKERVGHRMELRTWWYGTSALKLQTIGLTGPVINNAPPKKSAAEIAKAIAASRAADREYSQQVKINATRPAVALPNDEVTSFQSAAPWTPRVNINAQVAMVYGLNDLPERIGSWRDKGYKIHLMTGVSWGNYQDYLYGRFDGINHEDEAQTDRAGNRVSHGGDVYYMVPGPSYGRYLSEGVKRAIDAGAQSIHLEEPEFWVRSGYSEGFKREWKAFYNEDWQPPHSSIDAQYRASKLKYFLYGRALSQVFSFVRDYGRKIGRYVPCYVATHSLISYAQIGIVSPESSLLNVGCDGYIAQVWTGTARNPNVYQGVQKERTFEAAFLEYGSMQSMVRASGKRVWYLNDPVEDDPNHDWGDYQRNWESTLVASLLQPEVWHYEVMPWPQRPFEAKYEPAGGGERVGIGDAYETELQSVLTALNDMKQPNVSWQSAGARGTGVLVSDTMMFQRGAPQPSDARLGSFFGLAMPLVKRGVPVDPVQIENATQAGFLNRYKLLFLTYEGQKPPTPQFHVALSQWVKNGGALIVVDDDTDPFNAAREWWNTAPLKFATPRQHLFQTLGLPQDFVGTKRVGKGLVTRAKKSPAALSHDANGAESVRVLARDAAAQVGLPWSESNAMILRRGPYVVAAGLDESLPDAPPTLRGAYVNLFDAALPILPEITIDAGRRALLLDLDKTPKGAPRVLAAACRVKNFAVTPQNVRFNADGVSESNAVVLISLDKAPQSIGIAPTLKGRRYALEMGKLTDYEYDAAHRVLRLRFPNTPDGVAVDITR